MDWLTSYGAPILIGFFVLGVLAFVVWMLMKSMKLQQLAVDQQQDGMSRFDVSVEQQTEAIDLGRESLALTQEGFALTQEGFALTQEGFALSQESLEVTQEGLALAREALGVQREQLSELRQLRELLERQADKP